MRILRSLSFAVLFILVCFLVSPKVLVAQESAPTPTRLALEVTYYPGRKPTYQPVQVADSQTQGTWYALFGHIASWRPIAGAPVIRAVRLLPRIEGDAVRVIVSTMWGEKALNNEQRVASYLIRENEKIEIAVEVSAIGTKTKLLNDIQKLESEGTQALTANEYREWLNKTRDLYAQWLTRL